MSNAHRSILAVDSPRTCQHNPTPMPRELRKRTSRPNYAALLNYVDDEDEVVAQKADSGSRVAPKKPKKGNQDNDGYESSPLSAASEDEDEDEDMLVVGSDGDEESIAANKRSENKARMSVAHTARTPRHALNVPNIHHRHRAIPLYNKSGPVERLVRKPSGLAPSNELTLTNAWGSSKTVASRVGKAWGNNVGSGPLWELIEDRAWYGESNEEAEEKTRRPRVYTDLHIPLQCVVMDAE